MKLKIALDTRQDVKNFVDTVSHVDAPVFLSDGAHQQICAKSQLGAIFAKMEWNSIYCICDKDISGKILSWLVD